MSERLTTVQNSTVGLLTGALEITLLQPLNYIKNATQQGLPLTLDPRVLYRGYFAAVSNMGGCTMVQVACMGQIKRTMLGSETRDLSAQEQFAGGFLAGVTSALVGGPLELFMIQQQVKGTSISATARNLLGPQISRGVLPTAMREGVWTMGYLSVPPVVGGLLRSSFPDTFDTAEKARAPASVLGAFLVCVASHPFDTAKTCMQGDLEQKKFKSLTRTFAQLYKESSIAGFYRGVEWRFLRQAIAIFAMDTARGFFENLLFPIADDA